MIQVLGPFNSGSSLFNGILNSGIDMKIMNRAWWKHTLDLNRIESIVKNNPKCLFICVYRPFPFWVFGMLKAPYTLTWNRNLYSPCQMNETIHTIKNQSKFNNISDIYNKYYNNYIFLEKKYKNVIHVNYYKFIKKDTVYNYVSDILKPYNIKLEENFYHKLEKPIKKHGNPVKNSEEAFIRKQKIIDKINCSPNIKKYFDEHTDMIIKNYYEN